MNQRGLRFGFPDLLVLALVLLLGLGTLIAAAARSREAGRRAYCAKTLRAIGSAIQMYANDNNGEFPRTNWTGPADPNPVPTFFTGANSPDSFAAHGPAPNDVTAALFLVLRNLDLTPDVFTCPSDARAERLVGNVQRMSNFPGRQNLSYSYMMPYPSARARNAGFTLRFTMNSDLAIAADINPGGGALTAANPFNPKSDPRRGNTPNHGGVGQNVLYADGRVEFQASSFCGMARTIPGGPTFRDNIYYSGGSGTPGPAVLLAAPQDEKDSVLLPVAPEGPAKPSGVGSIYDALAGLPPPMRRAAAIAAGAAFLYWILFGFSTKVRTVRAGTPMTSSAG